ncbi:VOC family protein [Halobacillus sp. Marseille-Q1614]|uniref:VOC family protein n=1 Tax=Halobacillus sp. Marseille-Q1614 TaxID=2709134 RepID=UPI00156F1BD8|nr:VOC family protein [Halobacillus sp. Marseille-Q1614]
MLAFDHLVIASADPKADQKKLMDTQQLKGVPGGHHTLWGTYNELCYFSNDCYIEWLGLKSAETAAKSENPLIQEFKQTFDQGLTGPFQFALRTDDMEAYLKHFKENDIPYSGPFDGQRKRPDGSLLKWQMLFPKSPLYPLPFLIEWEGKNVPASGDDINLVRFLELKLGSSDPKKMMQVFQEIYLFDKPIGQLENGRLLMTKGEGITAVFNSFQIN